MSALAMILTAAMVIPGDGPEMASGEIRQGLDLSGEWVGTVKSSDGHVTGDVQLRNGKLRVVAKITYCLPEVRTFEKDWVYVDEEEGKLLLFESRRPGIFRQHRDRVTICYHVMEGKERPTDFQTGEGRVFYFLHRVKSRK